MSKYQRSEMKIEVHVPTELIQFLKGNAPYDNRDLENFFEFDLRRNELAVETNYATHAWANAHKGHIAEIIERLQLNSEPLVKPKER